MDGRHPTCGDLVVEGIPPENADSSLRKGDHTAQLKTNLTNSTAQAKGGVRFFVVDGTGRAPQFGHIPTKYACASYRPEGANSAVLRKLVRGDERELVRVRGVGVEVGVLSASRAGRIRPLGVEVGVESKRDGIQSARPRPAGLVALREGLPLRPN